MDSYNGNLQTDTYYIDLYCLDTLSEQLACQGFSKDVIGRVYGIYNLSKGNYASGLTGLGGQGIEETDNPLEII